MTPRSHTVGVLAFLLFALGVWSLTWTGSSAGRASEDAHVDVPMLDVLEGEAVVEEGPRRGAKKSPSNPLREAAADRAVAEVHESSSAPGEIRIDGRLVVVDPGGEEHETTSGEIELVRWNGSSGRPEKIAVRDGAFSLRFRPGDRLTCRRGELEGRAVLFARTALEISPPLDEDFCLRIRARWLGETNVRVVGDDTRADLRGIQVVACLEPLRDIFEHPTSSFRTLLRDAQSPIKIPEPRPAREESTLWVRATGYAWRRLVIRHGPENSRELRLSPSVGVDVALSRAAPEGSVLRLRPVSDRATSRAARAMSLPVAEFTPASRGLTKIRDVRAGTYELSLERGAWFGARQGYGHTQVVMQLGELHTVTLQVREPKAHPTVDLRGTVLVPRDWDCSSITLHFRPLGKTAVHAKARRLSCRSSTGEFAFEASDMPVGDFEVVIQPFAIRRRLRVEPGGEAARIVVPPPVDVVVEVVDKQSRVRLQTDRVFWRYPAPKGVRGSSFNAADVDAKTRTASFRAPLGTLIVTASVEGYAGAFQGEVVDLRPGENHVTLALERACGVELVLKDGAARLPWTGDCSAQLLRGDKNAVLYFSGAKITAQEAGTYVLRCSVPAGYEPVADRQVVVRAREYNEIVIPLVRKRE